MALIIISSNSRKEEQEIAEKILDVKSDYHGVNADILKEVEDKYHIDSGELNKALENTPSLLKKILSSQWKYRLACIEAEVLDRLASDNIVCWGLAAHLYVVGISHALKIRLIHNNENRIREMADLQGISFSKAEKWLATELTKRKKWGLAAYDRDETDPAQYDLVINLDQIDQNETVETITTASGYRKFQPITYSMKSLSDLALAAKVRTTLLKSMSDIRVEAKDGTILVYTKAFKQNKIEKVKQIKELAGNMDGVNFVEVHVAKNPLVPQISER